MDQWGPGPAHVTLTSASYAQLGDATSRVPNGDFSLGPTGWSFVGPAGYVTTKGRTSVRLDAASGVQAWAGSTRFAVTPGAAYTLSFNGTVPPTSTGNGAWLVAFFDPGNVFISLHELRFAPTPFPAGTVATGPDGSYSVDISAFGSGGLEIGASFDGGAVYWPAFAHIER
jgi:hypothetical protein